MRRSAVMRDSDIPEALVVAETFTMHRPRG